MRPPRPAGHRESPCDHGRGRTHRAPVCRGGHRRQRPLYPPSPPCPSRLFRPSPHDQSNRQAPSPRAGPACRCRAGSTPERAVNTESGRARSELGCPPRLAWEREIELENYFTAVNADLIWTFRQITGTSPTHKHFYQFLAVFRCGPTRCTTPGLDGGQVDRHQSPTNSMTK